MATPRRPRPSPTTAEPTRPSSTHSRRPRRHSRKKDEAAQAAANRLEAENEERRKKQEEEKKKQDETKDDEDDETMPNPDAGPVTLRTARQVEAMLTGTKHPVSPGGGDGGPFVDLASPPRRQGGMDPTIALFPADAPAGGWAGGSTSAKLLSAPIDYDRDREPPQLAPPAPGAGSPYGQRP